MSTESTKYVSPTGVIRYRDSDGNRHREDGPAVIYPSGTELWYHHGELHREDGPAITGHGGRFRQWWKNDKKLDPLVVFLLEGECNE